MQNLLTRLAEQSGLPSLPNVIFALLVSAAGTVILFVIYEVFYPRKELGSQVHRAFFLIGPSTTALFISIQFSLPLSLGLLGALSFIRFRTPIKDPEEIAYLLCLVAFSIGSATFNYMLVLLLLTLVVTLLLIRRWLVPATWSAPRRGHVLISGRSENLSDTRASQALTPYLDRLELFSLTRAGSTLNLHYTFRITPTLDRAALARDLETLPGVERFDLMTGDA